MSKKCDNKTTFCDAGFYCNNGECSPCVCDKGKLWNPYSRYGPIAGGINKLCKWGSLDVPAQDCLCPVGNRVTTELLDKAKQTYCIDPPGPQCTYGQWYDENEKKCEDCPCEDPGYKPDPLDLETRKLCPGNNTKAVLPAESCIPRCRPGEWYDQDEKTCKTCQCEDPGYKPDDEFHGDAINAACPGYGLKANTIPAKACKPRCRPGQWYDQDEKECKNCPCQDPGYKPDVKNKGVADACPGYGLETNTIPTKECIPLCFPGYAINKKKYPNGWGPYAYFGGEPHDGCKLCTCESDQPESSGANYKLPTDPQKKKAVQSTFCPGNSFTNSSGDSNLIPDTTCELNCSKQKTWPKIVKDGSGVNIVEKICDTCLCNQHGTVVGWTTPTVPSCPAKDSSCSYIGKYLVCDEKDCYAYNTKPTSSQISERDSCFFSTSGCEDDLKKPSTSVFKNNTNDAYWDCDIRDSDGKKCGTFSKCYRLCSWKYPTGYSTSSNNLPSGNNNPPPGWN